MSRHERLPVLAGEHIQAYWGKQIFAHGRFPEVGLKQKTEKKRERKTERW